MVRMETTIKELYKSLRKVDSHKQVLETIMDVLTHGMWACWDDDKIKNYLTTLETTIKKGN